MSDTPEYTDRELSQRLLIDHIGEILTQTGRSTGFPGETVYTGKVAKWGEDGGHLTDGDRPETWDKAIAGPPAVAITRVVRDGRTSAGPLTAEGVLNAYNPQTLVNSFIPKQTLNLLDLDTAILNILVPFVKVYKVYPNPGGDPLAVEFKPSWLKSNPRHVAAFSGDDQPQHKDVRVGFTGCTIAKMGENPGLVDSNITVQLTVETQDLNNLFYRWKIPYYEKLSKSVVRHGKSLTGESAKALKNGVAWIDLIKMNPKGTTNSNSCDLSYDPPTSEIKLVIGYGEPSPSQIRRIISDANKRATVYKNVGEANAVIAKRSNRTLTEAAKAKIIADAKHNEALIDDIGLEAFNAKLDQAGQFKFDDVFEAIKNHREIFYLQLSHHEFIVGPDLQVELKIHYIGRSELMNRTPGADLLNDQRVRAVMTARTQQVDSLKAQLGDLQEILPSDGMPTDSPEYAEIMAKNSDRADCRGPVQQRLDELQSDYDAMLKISKKRLYNQLLLKGHDASRIYKVRIPKTLSLRPDWRGKDSAAASELGDALLIRNYRDKWWTEGTDHNSARRSPLASSTEDQAALDAHANGEEMNDEASSTSDDRENLLNKVFSAEDQNYYQLNFVFIGDIVEAALELVAYNNEYFGLKPPPSPGLVSGRSQQDDMPVTAFYREAKSDGSLGPLATATIDLLGKYVFGDIVLPLRANDGATRYANIADIPIDVEYFRTFWFNKVVSKPKQSSYFLKDLINGIMTDLIPYAIKSRAVSALTTNPGKPPQTRINHFPLPGTGTGLNVKLKTELAPTPEPKKAAKPDPKALPAGMSKEQKEMWEEEGVLAGPADREVKYVPYFTASDISKQLAADFKTYAQTPNNVDVYEVILIQQKPEGTVMRTGSRAIDKAQSIQHYILNVANKKALISATFKRNDIPMMKTANLMQDSVINSRGIMREKYDADVLLRGNVVYKPGAVLYLDHTRLQSSHIDADIFNQSKNGGTMLPWALQVSPARALGLGGYFTVSGVSHDFGHLGTGKKWTTTLVTRWLSFEHIEGLPDSCGEEPVVPGLPPPIAESCLIDAAEDRIERAEKAAKEAQEANEAATEEEIRRYRERQSNKSTTPANPNMAASSSKKY